jgi:uncharacterized repeat protein (TIGR01451 family)
LHYTRKAFTLLSSVVLGLLSFSVSPTFGFSTHPTTTCISRSFDKVQSVTGRSITATVTFINNEAGDLRGFYYVDHVPEGLTVNPVSVKINGANVSDYVFEFGWAGDVYDGCIPYRWILETPSTFDENNPIGSAATLEIVYALRATQGGTFHVDEFHWVGYYQGETTEAFGHSEEIDGVSLIFRWGFIPALQLLLGG